jgi:integrase
MQIVSRTWLTQLQLQAVTSAHVKRLLGEMAKEGKSAATCQLARAVLSRALSDAVDDRKLARNPAARLRGRAYGGKPARAKASTARELRRLLDHVAGERLEALWRLAAMTGMRRGEVLGLTWRCLDLEGGHLDVEQQLVPTQGGPTFGPPKSARSRRRVALGKETVAALKAHREAQQLERSFAGDAYEDHDLVFCSATGAPIPPGVLTTMFEARRKAAKLPKLGLHGLRHTHATHLLTIPRPVHAVAARLGDRPEQILRTYAHLLPLSDEDSAEQAEALIA